jgi:hypothetical protein
MLARAPHRDVGNSHAARLSNVLPYRGRVPRKVGKWDYAALLRILFVNSCNGQRGYSENVRRVRIKAEELIETEAFSVASQDARKRWAELERLVSICSAFIYCFDVR